MNIRFLILIGIMLILVGVVLISSIQIAMHYMRSNAPETSESVEVPDSKEQLISELATENERLKAELDNYKQDD